LRWTEALQEYQFTFIYCKGTENTIADSLLRVEHSLTSFPLQASKIAATQEQDESLLQIIRQLRSGTPAILAKNYMIINIVLHFIERDRQLRIRVPQQLQSQYLTFYHDHQLSGHFGFQKVRQKIRLINHWPKMRTS
jgi:hypothetical protein